MTRRADAAPAQAPDPARKRGWVKALLIGSLVLNFALIGAFAGSQLRHNTPPPMQRGEMGLGPLTAVLSREDWKAMRPAFLARHPDLRRGKMVLKADFDPVLAALRAENFDPAAFDRALDAISRQNAERLVSAQQVISDYLKSLTSAERQDFARRLERRLEEGPQGRSDHDGRAKSDGKAAP